MCGGGDKVNYKRPHICLVFPAFCLFLNIHQRALVMFCFLCKPYLHSQKYIAHTLYVQYVFSITKFTIVNKNKLQLRSTITKSIKVLMHCRNV